MFFIIVSPGLEKLAHAEACEKFPKLHFEITNGGLNVDASLEYALAFNQWLKIPTRVIYRLFETRARDLPKLYKKIKNFDWRPYYVKSPAQIKVTSISSRLFDDRKISKTVIDGIDDFFKATQAKKVDLERLEKEVPPALYLRFENDDLVLSIDTSGERLDRRGVRTWIGEAPLRETYAHACLHALLKETGSKIDLCDAMAGSGVFVREALDWQHPNDKRPFSCQLFPSLKHSESSIEVENPFHSLLAIESDEKTFKALKHNCNDAKLIHGNCLEQLELTSGLVFIANPPYGIRLKLDNPTAFLNNVVRKLKAYQPRGIGLLVPKEIRFEEPHKVLLEFSHGGIAVKFIFF